MDTLLATEAEVIQSDMILRTTNEEALRGVGFTLAREAIRAKRRGRELILDLSVTDADSARALRMCDVLIATYIRYRHATALMSIQRQQQVMWEDLERRPGDAELKRQTEELEERARAVRGDAAGLDRCRIVPRKG